MDFERVTVTALREDDVSFPGQTGDNVSATLTSPSDAAPPRPGILFLHWGFGDRTSFAIEALALARAGAVALCIDAPGYGARKGPRAGAREPAQVRAYAEQLLGDLARAVDFSGEQPGVDATRLGYVGHSLGATIAGAFLARDPRIKAAVLMAGTGTLSRLWLQRRDSEGALSLEDLDSVRCLPKTRASLLFQFADRDAWISRADAEAQLTAARDPKQAKWYACDHALDAAALQDCAHFLARQLAFEHEPEPPPGRDAAARTSSPLPRDRNLHALEPLAEALPSLRQHRRVTRPRLDGAVASPSRPRG